MLVISITKLLYIQVAQSTKQFKILAWENPILTRILAADYMQIKCKGSLAKRGVGCRKREHPNASKNTRRLEIAATQTKPASAG